MASDPKFSSNIKSRRQVAALMLTYEDGTQEELVFHPSNQALYTVRGNTSPELPPKRQYYNHDISWIENHVPEVPLEDEAVRGTTTDSGD